MDRSRTEELFDLACDKVVRNTEKIGGDLREFPARADGDYFAGDREQYIPLSHIFNWTQSFFTGMAALACKHTGDNRLLRWLYGFYPQYHAKVFETPMDTMHDTGFLYTLYSTALFQLCGDANMRALSIQAAKVFAGRFVPNGGYIQAWGRMDGKIPPYVGPQLARDNFFANSKGLAIIDCMMNLPLLFWAGRQTGHPFYTSLATAHADTTLRYFVRPDGSVCHAYRFDPTTGRALEEFNDCGYAVGSHWARGTAWAVYGFAVAYKYTQKEEYRDAALLLARRYIESCPPNGIPVWDFRLPADTPARYSGKQRAFDLWDIHDPANIARNVDTSAAAIMCNGIMQLGRVGDMLRDYLDAASQTLLEQYLNLDPDLPGLLKSQNGNGHYAVYGDYFVFELMARQLGLTDGVW